VLPYEEFLAIQERLADADDLMELRKAKRAEGKKKSRPLAEVQTASACRSRLPSAVKGILTVAARRVRVYR
jgi:hypothetical protein